MPIVHSVDWAKVFVPSESPLEIVVRGTLVYLGIYLLLRVVVKRQWSETGVTDLLVVVLIADAAQNAMADEYRSVPDGLLLVAVIVTWSWVLDRLSFRYPWLARLLKPRKLQLVDHGRILWRNMAKEMVTKEELDSELRGHGINDVRTVASAFMEGNGRITVVGYGESDGESGEESRRSASDEPVGTA